MAVLQLINEIIDNFKNQHYLYQQMSHLSRSEMEVLKKKYGPEEADEISSILNKRGDINEKVDLLNQENKNLQIQLTSTLGINEFSLSKMKVQLDDKSYEKLENILRLISQELIIISDLDQQSQQILGQSLSRSREKKVTVDVKRVQTSYKKVMEESEKLR